VVLSADAAWHMFSLMRLSKLPLALVATATTLPVNRPLASPGAFCACTCGLRLASRRGATVLRKPVSTETLKSTKPIASASVWRRPGLWTGS
jgi:hypothetical protein